MGLQHDIELLEKRILLELDDAHDYKEHNVVVWRTFQQWVALGNKVKSTNVDTGNTVTEGDLVGLAQRYNSEFLLEFTFQHLVSLVETFVFDLLKLLFSHAPQHRLSLKKQLSVETILAANDWQSLIEFLVDRELDDVKYKRVAIWFERLHSIVNIDCPSDDEISRFAEIKASRDILVHNAHVVNETYADKAGNHARFQVGDRLDIPGHYYRSSWQLLRKLVADVAKAAKAKYSP